MLADHGPNATTDGFMSRPRQGDTDVREHHSTDLFDGRCDTDLDDPITDVGGYLPCGCHASQRDHTCIPFD